MLKNVKKIMRSWPCLVAAGLFAAYLLFAYLAVDPLARRLLPWVAQNQLASRASVEHVRFDPFKLAVTVDKLRLTRADGAPLAGFERLYVDLETSGLLRFAWRFGEIRLTGPQAVLDVAPNGKLNWADLLAKLNEDKQKSDDTVPRVLIDHLVIERGDIAYAQRNRATPFKAALAPLDVELNRLSTLREDRGDYQLIASLPQQGGTLKWKGSIGLNPIVSTGAVALEGIKVAELMRIAPAQDMPLALTAGQLQARFNYRFAMTNGPAQPTPELAVNDVALSLDDIKGKLAHAPGSGLGLQHLGIKLPELNFSMRQGLQLTLRRMEVKLTEAALQLADAPLFRLPQAQLGGIDVDWAARRVNVAQALLTDGAVQAKRHADGSFDWQRLLAPKPAGDALVQAGAAAAAPANKKQDERPLRVDIANIQLKHWQAGYQDASFKQPLRLGVQDINLGFALSNADGGLRVKDIESALGPLTLSSALSREPAATMDKLSLHGGDISVKDSTVKVQAIVLSGLRTKVLRQANKPLNWQALLEPARQAPAAKPVRRGADVKQAHPAPGWKLALDRIGLENAAVHFEDKSTAPPVSLDIENAAFDVRDGSLDLARPLPVNARFTIKQGGQFDVDGKLALDPFKSDVKFKLKELSLKPFSPYINQAALLKLDSGSASINGKLALKYGQALSTQFEGGFRIDKLAISEEGSGAAFIGWKSLAGDRLTLAVNPNRLHLNELRVVQPVGKVIIHEDKTVNITRILRESAQPAQAPAGTGGGTPQALDSGKDDFPVTVERVKIENGNLEFADLSLKPQFGTYINTLSGVINGLSSRPDSTAQVELDGKVDEFGSARIRGEIQAFRATDFTDLKLSFHNLDMHRLTPYSGKFAGRRIESGKMSVDLEYNIKKRQLAGENKFVINKLKLGERVDSADAVSLPLDLAIALLEDSDGLIDLDLPVSGSLDDPQFSYGKIVWKALVNVLGKIATAPFRALGKLFGVSSDKLESVAFDAGSADLAPPEREKLKTVGLAMVKRPALMLTLVPAYDPLADRKALQALAIRRDVALEMGLKLRPDENPGPVDLNNPKVQTLIQKMAKNRSPEAKNRKLLDKFKDIFDTSKPADPAAYRAMLQQLEQWVPVSDKELIALAEARAAAMRQVLAQSSMDAGRLNKSEPVPVSGSGREVALKMTLGAAR